MRSELERLLDILEAVKRIEKYAAQGKMAFERFCATLAQSEQRSVYR